MTVPGCAAGPPVAGESGTRTTESLHAMYRVRSESGMRHQRDSGSEHSRAAAPRPRSVGEERKGQPRRCHPAQRGYGRGAPPSRPLRSRPLPGHGERRGRHEHAQDRRHVTEARCPQRLAGRPASRRHRSHSAAPGQHPRNDHAGPRWYRGDQEKNDKRDSAGVAGQAECRQDVATGRVHAAGGLNASRRSVVARPPDRVVGDVRCPAVASLDLREGDLLRR